MTHEQNLTNVVVSAIMESDDPPDGLTPTEWRFIKYCRAFGWGTLIVRLKHGEPVQIRVHLWDIKLDN